METPNYSVKVENKVAGLIYEHKNIEMLKPELNRNTEIFSAFQLGQGSRDHKQLNIYFYIWAYCKKFKGGTGYFRVF